jgi:exosortase/archaeosortase family protein
VVTRHNPTLTKLKAAKPLLVLLAAFMLCFAIVASILGIHIINAGLFFKYGFQWYGEAGKSLLFAALALALLVWRKEAKFPKLNAWRLTNILWLGLAFLATTIEWLLIDKSIKYHLSISLVLLAHLAIIVLAISLLLGWFGIKNCRLLAQYYRIELLIAGGLCIGFFVFLISVYGTWTVLSSIVLHSVKEIFGIIGISSVYLPPQTLVFSKFAISIAEGCSGIESIALFTSLFGLVGVLDWQRLDQKKYLIIFVPALLILFGFNILRVFVLILAGYYINPTIAFSLFHTYAGMLFFIIYSLIFWSLAYKWMLHKNPKTLR